MAGRREAPQITLGQDERTELEASASRRKTTQAMATRACIVLARAARRVKTSPPGSAWMQHRGQVAQAFRRAAAGGAL